MPHATNFCSHCAAPYVLLTDIGYQNLQVAALFHRMVMLPNILVHWIINGVSVLLNNVIVEHNQRRRILLKLAPGLREHFRRVYGGEQVAKPRGIWPQALKI